MGIAGRRQLRHGPDDARRAAPGRALRLARGLRARADPGRARAGSRSRCWPRSRPRPSRPVRVARPARRRSRERDAWRLCGLYAVTFGGFVGLASFLPIFFHDQYGLSKVDAATIVAVGAALGSLLRPLGGHLADRARRHDGAHRRLRRRRGAAAVRLRRCPPLGAAAVAFPLVMGTLRRRQRRGLPARRPALPRADRRADRPRRRRRRPRRLLPADAARRAARRVRLLRRRASARSPAAPPSPCAGRWSCAAPGSRAAARRRAR